MPTNQNNHQKPTKEELKAKEEEAIAEAEKIEKEGLPPEEDEEEPTPDPEPEQDPEPEPKEEEPEEETEEEPKEEEKKEPQADPSKELYKKKFSESSKENQKIYAKNRLINKAIADAKDVPEPTQEELEAEFTDWELMSDVEKVFAKETVISRNWRQTIAKAQEQATKIEKWNESVDEFTTNPSTLTDNPDLEGKTEEFQDFAKQESNNSVPFNILVAAFLHESSKTKPTNKGRMFERAKGGSNEKPLPKKNTLTLEEGRVLRETNYDLWKEKLKAGLIVADF